MQETPYSTTNELDFIKRLGTFSGRGQYVTRGKLLEGYLEGCKLRVNWGSVSSHEILDFVEKELERI